VFKAGAGRLLGAGYAVRHLASGKGFEVVAPTLGKMACCGPRRKSRGRTDGEPTLP
jgi:hypothetical protein